MTMHGKSKFFLLNFLQICDTDKVAIFYEDLAN
jgi:hypothetical protein